MYRYNVITVCSGLMETMHTLSFALERNEEEEGEEEKINDQEPKIDSLKHTQPISNFRPDCFIDFDDNSSSNDSNLDRI